ncbi:MAG TPA: hypothetical protein VHJ38_03450 [Nitrososphaeraceae archaeon]|nr:hypothetical protein [Nitrososphaeraceae archaeon]
MFSIVLTISVITLLAFEQTNFANLKTYSYSQGKFLVDHSFNWNIDPKENKYNLNNKEKLQQ